MTDRRDLWLSSRALRLHLVLLVVLPAFLAMCLWQLSRALGGNELSWAYVFEWPLFAVYAVYMWWRLLHESSGDATAETPAAAARDLSTVPAPGAAGTDRTDAEMAAYNEYLALLAEQDRATGR